MLGDKRKILVGIVFIVLALLGIVGIFYLMVDAQRQGIQEADSLKEKIAILSDEKALVVERVARLEGEVGESLNLGRLLEEANQVYDEKEKNRREGHLWVDRKTRTIVVTLGALNGLRPGSLLKVYDGDDFVGTVTVETSLDVISYAKPHRKFLNQYEKDYYRVVFEQ